MPQTIEHASDWTGRLGFWSAALITLAGIVYLMVIAGMVIAGEFTLPPAEPVQLFGGISSLFFCPALVVLFACLHAATPADRRVLSQIALGFTLLFALSVSINRFTQLGVVRQSLADGTAAPGVEWFLAYGERSVMLGLEYLGWGWFLGLALLFAAPLFAGSTRRRWLRGLAILYGVMGLVSAIGFLIGSPLSLVGFAAWGVVLYVVTALLALEFRRGSQNK